MHKNWICLLIISILNLIPLVIGKNQKQIQFDTTQRGSLDGNQYHFYKVKLMKKQDFQDLVFILEGVNPSSQPELFISKVSNYPTSNDNNYEKYCISLDLAVCTYDHQDIDGDQWFYMGVTCLNDCVYKLTVEYKPEDMIEVNQKKNLFGKSAQTDVRLFKLQVPAEDEMDNIDEIQIQVFVQNASNFKQFEFYVAEGDVTPSTNNSLWVSDLWHQGKQCIISKADHELKFNTMYSILVEIPEDTFVSLQVFAYEEVREIDLYEQVFDLIDVQKELRIYKITIDEDKDKLDWENTTIDVQLTPFIGNSDLYINHDTLPDRLVDFAWISKEEIREQILITPQEREFKNMQSKTFYIAVNSTGYLASTFNLVVKPYDKNLMQLKFDFPVTGIILKDEIINFKHVVKGSQNMQIDIDLIHEQGNPDLFAKRCEDLEQCEITLDEIKQRYSSGHESDNMFHFSDHIGAKDLISFEHDSTDCQRIQHSEDNNVEPSTQECSYVIAIYGNNLEQFNESKYTLIAKHNLGPQILREGIPDRNEVYQGGYNYYSFSIPKSMDQIQRAKILVTQVSGQVQLVASTKQQQPKLNGGGDIIQSFMHQPYIELKQSVDKPLNGNTYYVGVYGSTQAEYIINIVFQHTDSQFNSVFFLKQDTPQSIVLHQVSEKIYFSMKAPKKDENPNLTIWIKPIHGYYDMYMSPTKDFLNMEEQYVWKSENNLISIPASDQSYSESGYFYGIVTPIELGQDTETHDFMIGYHDSYSVLTLQQNEAFNDFIGQKESRRYRFRVYRDQTIKLTKKTQNDMQNVLDMYMSLDQQNRHPSKDQNDGKMEANRILTISSELINSKCEDFNNKKIKDKDLKPCYVYLTAESSQNVYYSLFISNDEKVEMKEYQYLEMQLPLENSARHFYMFTKGAQFPITIAEYQLNVKTHLFAKVIKRNASENPDDFGYPIFDYDNNMFTGNSTNNYNRIVINQSDIKNLNCQSLPEGCVILVSVFVDPDEFTYSRDKILEESFSISIFSIAQPLQEGHIYQSYIDLDEFQYFTFSVGDDDTSITITANPIDNVCDPGILVQKGKLVKDKDTYDWENILYGPKHIYFTPKDKFDTAKGTYYIKIYGHKAGAYQIQFHIGKFSLSSVSIGTQSLYQVQKNQPIYLEYRHFYHRGFKVVNSLNYGDIRVDIKPNMQQEDYAKIEGKIQEELDYKWSSVDTNHHETLKINTKDENFCYFCTYLIKLTPTQNTQLTTLIHLDDSQIILPDNNLIHDQLDKHEQAMFKYYNQHQGVDLKITLLTGDLTVYVREALTITPDSYDIKQSTDGKKYLNIEFQAKKNTGQSQFVYDPILILVQAEQNTKYTIQALPNRQAPRIQMGIPYYDDLKPGDEQVYYLKINNDDHQFKKRKISVNLLMHNPELASKYFNNTNKQTYDFHPKLRLKDIALQKDIECIHKETTYISISCEFLANSNEYYLVVKNDKLAAELENLDITYSIVMNDNNLIYVQENHPLVHSTQQSLSSYYEIIPPVMSQMVLEIYQCFGTVDVTTSHNLQELKQGNYEERIQRYSSFNHFVSINKVYSKPMYLKVHSNQGVNKSDSQDQIQDKYSRYQLNTRFYPINAQIPYHHFAVGNMGNLSYQRLDKETIRVSFLGVVCYDCQNLDFYATSIEYKLYITSEASKNDIQYQSRCKSQEKDQVFNSRILEEEEEGNQIEETQNDSGAQIHLFKKLFNHLSFFDLKKIVFDIPLDTIGKDRMKDRNTYYTVTAIMKGNNKKNKEQIEQFKFIYNINTITPKEFKSDNYVGQKQKYNWTLIIICIIVYIMLVAFLAYTCTQKRKLKKQVTEQRITVGSSIDGIEMSQGGNKSKELFQKFNDENEVKA